ncbi:MAG: hypothetical protein QOI36_3735 [Pseudonocardiales bacterium]|nr:hypothetical protein [Pseudonocardiales bacterium]
MINFQPPLTRCHSRSSAVIGSGSPIMRETSMPPACRCFCVAGRQTLCGHAGFWTSRIAGASMVTAIGRAGEELLVQLGGGIRRPVGKDGHARGRPRRGT